ncbi:MAG: ABC transporter ATP-binding protein [Propionibacteriaceae bacterium]|jgi:ABC-2 type transport system ATP-binding protein|nr:ABC transporter ATP-binding protein [Propionibacteriaceae bacterium]
MPSPADSRPPGDPVQVRRRQRPTGGATPVLKQVSLALGPGLHVVVGPNGSGKTTLLRVICGLLPPSSGTVRRPGGSVGYLTHRAALSGRLTARDNLRYWALVQGQAAGRVDVVSRQVGADQFADQPAAQLSRGQTQRLMLARALLSDPALLLLDEPLSGVDPSGVSRLLDLFARLAAERRCLVVSSHSLAELSRLEGDVVALRDGAIAGQGRARDLLARAAGRTTRLRLRGGAGLAAAVRDLGHTARETGDGSVEVETASDQNTTALVRALAARGLDLFEISPVVDDLTQLYGLLEQDPPARPGG